MLKISFKLDGVIYPVTSLDMVDCVPYVATIFKDGKFESFLNSRNVEHPYAIDFNHALIIENPKYELYEKLIEEGVKIYLKDLISHDLGGK